jgi:hypothetical protein
LLSLIVHVLTVNGFVYVCLFSDCSQPKPGLMAVLLLALWVQAVVVFVGLSGRAGGASKVAMYFVQVGFFASLSLTVFADY